MRRVIRSLKFGVAEATGFGGYYVWRGLERCLSTGGLYRAAWAFYFWRAVFNELFARSKPPRDQPEWLRTDNSTGARIRRRTEKYVNGVPRFFPDRLADPKWRSQCQLEGGEHLRAARSAGRPVVLAFFHFGPFYLMRAWAQAYGFPAAVFITPHQASHGRLARFRNRLTPFPEVPTVFVPGELRAATEFVKAGNILFIAVDTVVGRHRHTTAEVDGGWIINLNSGAARLANKAGADLIQASIITEGPWRFRIKFSPPIPGEGLQTQADWEKANRSMLEKILPDFKAHPEQLTLSIKWKRAANEPKTGETTAGTPKKYAETGFKS